MKKTIALLSLLTINSAFALGLPALMDQTKKLQSNQLIDFETEYDFNGIAKLGNCSGSIIQFAGQSNDSPAILMTNGHCIKSISSSRFLKPGEVVVDREVNFRAKIYNNELDLIPVRSTKLLYATMTNTDVAYYELTKTYKELDLLGIQSFELDTFMPLLGTSIDIVSGYWDRGYRCEIDGLIFALLEADWTFTNSIRYTEKCDTIGGTSGSPIIETGTRKVIGINNTGNKDDGDISCNINNPCEQTEQGEVGVMFRSYGQQTFNIYSCLTVDFQIDLTKQGCDLPK